MRQYPLNPEPDGTSRTIKANYHKVSRANFTRTGGGTEQRELSCLKVGMIWRSQQNGMVYDPDGIAPCVCVGNHSGVEPKIIEYEPESETSD